MGSGFPGFLARTGQVLRGINEGNDEQDTRDHTRAVRASGIRRLDAEDSTLTERTDATRAAARLGTARDTTAAARLPAEARLADTQTSIQQGLATNTLGQLGRFIDAGNTELATRLNTTKLAFEQSKIALDQMPATVAQAKAKGALTELQVNDMLTAGLAHALQIGDKAVTQRYIQSVADSGMFPQLSGIKVGDIGTMAGPDKKPLFVVQDADGKPVIAMSGDRLTAAYERANPAEWKVLGDGGSLARVQGGKATIVATNPKDFKPADGIARTAADQKNEDMRMSRGKSVIDSYFGANSLSKLEASSQANYIQATKRMGELVRQGMAPEAAAAAAIDEIARKGKIDAATRHPGGPADAPAHAPGRRDYKNLWGDN